MKQGMLSENYSYCKTIDYYLYSQTPQLSKTAFLNEEAETFDEAEFYQTLKLYDKDLSEL